MKALKEINLGVEDKQILEDKLEESAIEARQSGGKDECLELVTSFLRDKFLLGEPEIDLFSSVFRQVNTEKIKKPSNEEKERAITSEGILLSDLPGNINFYSDESLAGLIFPSIKGTIYLDENGEVYSYSQKDGKWHTRDNLDLLDLKVGKALKALTIDLNRNLRIDDFQKMRSRISALGNDSKIRAVTNRVYKLLSQEPKFNEFKAPKDKILTKTEVLDLRTGECLPFSPDYYFTESLGCSYNKDADLSLAEGLLDSIAPESRRVTELLLAQGLIGEYSSVMPIFLGRGRNGKSILLHLYSKTLGGYCDKISSDFIQSEKHDSQVITAGKGRRAIFWEETKQGSKINAVSLKTLVGSTSFSMRVIYKKQETIDNQVSLFGASNYLPLFEGDTAEAESERVLIVDFPYTYTISPKRENDRLIDRSLQSKIDEGEEYKQSLLRLLRERAQEILEDPEIIDKNITEDMRNRVLSWVHQDPFMEIFSSILDRTEDENDLVLTSDLIIACKDLGIDKVNAKTVATLAEKSLCDLDYRSSKVSIPAKGKVTLYINSDKEMSEIADNILKKKLSHFRKVKFKDRLRKLS